MISSVRHCHANVVLSSLHCRLVAEQQQCPDGSFYCGGVSSLQILTKSVTHRHTSSYSFGQNETSPDIYCISHIVLFSSELVNSGN